MIVNPTVVCFVINEKCVSLFLSAGTEEFTCTHLLIISHLTKRSEIIN